MSCKPNREASIYMYITEIPEELQLWLEYGVYAFKYGIMQTMRN